MKTTVLLLAALTVLSPLAVQAQVLGPCGSDDAETPGAALKTVAAQATTVKPAVSRIPLPGEKAPNFELNALMGDGTVKKIKLSDFDGKWRIVCFYPADFTFV